MASATESDPSAPHMCSMASCCAALPSSRDVRMLCACWLRPPESVRVTLISILLSKGGQENLCSCMLCRMPTDCSVRNLNGLCDAPDAVGVVRPLLLEPHRGCATECVESGALCLNACRRQFLGLELSLHLDRSQGSVEGGLALDQIFFRLLPPSALGER